VTDCAHPDKQGRALNNITRHTSPLIACLLLCACAGPQAVITPQDQPHLGDAWFVWRAQTLHLSPDEARARDAALPGAQGPVPEGALDEHTAREAAALWQALCAGCHGADGAPPPVPEGQPEPRAWGAGSRMGFFFGGDKMRQGLFKAIDEGKTPGMPAWGQTLSREQIWALVAHLEGF
jgi:mono/diheme cytochrome c family protein